jgi:hypothetical protein
MGKSEDKRAAIVAAQAAREAAELEARRQAGTLAPSRRRARPNWARRPGRPPNPQTPQEDEQK